ncbi:MFS general substrate transporter [Mycena venus]|uniref:MFS general substrate transporter n=1 Tax=Mycena venus TaxID=2733690 RepID=A0A8H6Z2W2_9AGAR|nr:MFS general substrate transporter [Mycena venus]
MYCEANTASSYAYTFGVYKNYYVRVFLPKHSPSSIAWIGSFQLMMPSLLGPFAGKTFDDGGFYMLEVVGCSIFTFSVFMLSLCKLGQYYQVFLAQAVGMGIGLGLTFLPTVSIVVHHFKRHRGLTSGIMSGSSIGATVFPIMVNHLLPRFGFVKTICYSGAIVPPVLVLGNLMMRTRLPPRSKRGGNTASPNIKSFFSDAPYMIAILGCVAFPIELCMDLVADQHPKDVRWPAGALFSFDLQQLFSVQHNVDSSLAFYSVSMLNAAGAFIRVLGNH